MKETKANIAVVFNKKRKPELTEKVLEIIKWLEGKGHKVFPGLTIGILEKGLDFIVVAGGDGEILHRADIAAPFRVPLVGINFGHEGFLCEIEREERALYLKLQKILDGFYRIEERTRIQAEVYNKRELISHIDALNEIVIGGITRTVNIKILVREKQREFTATVKGDGAIFSTETGSTAYAVNAGSSVVLIDALTVVANNALFESSSLPLNTKSFVISTGAEFKVRSLYGHKENLPFVIGDGQRNYKLQPGDSVSIKRSPWKTLFLKIGK